MNKTESRPFTEAPQVFEAEREYLNQEPNGLIFFLNSGKAISRGDSGELFFTPMSESEKPYFMYGTQVEAEYLEPVSALKDEDKEELHVLLHLEKELGTRGLHAVAREKEKEGKEEVYYATIFHPGHSENTYFRISIPDLHALTQEQVGELLSFDAERSLDNPYQVQLADRMMLAY